MGIWLRPLTTMFINESNMFKHCTLFQTKSFFFFNKSLFAVIVGSHLVIVLAKRVSGAKVLLFLKYAHKGNWSCTLVGMYFTDGICPAIFACSPVITCTKIILNYDHQSVRIKKNYIRYFQVQPKSATFLLD